MPKDHTTPMLVAVLSIFLLTELPQGVMLVLTGVFSQDTFHQKVRFTKNCTNVWVMRFLKFINLPLNYILIIDNLLKAHFLDLLAFG